MADRPPGEIDGGAARAVFSSLISAWVDLTRGCSDAYFSSRVASLASRAARRSLSAWRAARPGIPAESFPPFRPASRRGDRKSTRLNSSHLVISYAVFCLKKKKESIITTLLQYARNRRCHRAHPLGGRIQLVVLHDLRATARTSRLMESHTHDVDNVAIRQ